MEDYLTDLENLIFAEQQEQQYRIVVLDDALAKEIKGMVEPNETFDRAFLQYFRMTHIPVGLTPHAPLPPEQYFPLRLTGTDAKKVPGLLWERGVFNLFDLSKVLEKIPESSDYLRKSQAEILAWLTVVIPLHGETFADLLDQSLDRQSFFEIIQQKLTLPHDLRFSTGGATYDSLASIADAAGTIHQKQPFAQFVQDLSVWADSIREQGWYFSLPSVKARLSQVKSPVELQCLLYNAPLPLVVHGHGQVVSTRYPTISTLDAEDHFSLQGENYGIVLLPESAFQGLRVTKGELETGDKGVSYRDAFETYLRKLTVESTEHLMMGNNLNLGDLIGHITPQASFADLQESVNSLEAQIIGSRSAQEFFRDRQTAERDLLEFYGQLSLGANGDWRNAKAHALLLTAKQSLRLSQRVTFLGEISEGGAHAFHKGWYILKDYEKEERALDVYLVTGLMESIPPIQKNGFWIAHVFLPVKTNGHYVGIQEWVYGPDAATFLNVVELARSDPSTRAIASALKETVIEMNLSDLAVWQQFTTPQPENNPVHKVAVKYVTNYVRACKDAGTYTQAAFTDVELAAIADAARLMENINLNHGNLAKRLDLTTRNVKIAMENSDPMDPFFHHLSFSQILNTFVEGEKITPKLRDSMKHFDPYTCTGHWLEDAALFLTSMHTYLTPSERDDYAQRFITLRQDAPSSSMGDFSLLSIYWTNHKKDLIFTKYLPESERKAHLSPAENALTSDDESSPVYFQKQICYYDDLHVQELCRYAEHLSASISSKKYIREVQKVLPLGQPLTPSSVITYHQILARETDPLRQAYARTHLLAQAAERMRKNNLLKDSLSVVS